MTILRAIRLVIILAVSLAFQSPACALDEAAKPAAAAVHPPGPHDFDFEFGNWRVHHRVKRAGQAAWQEFDGTCTTRGLIDGSANVEEHTFDKADGVTRGIALRAFDLKSGLWAIWWIDGRDPHGSLDPPVKGRFENGVGTFFSDGLLAGKPVRTRFTWSHITPTSAHWEQAYSYDAGTNWDTNWVMEFKRIP